MGFRVLGHAQREFAVLANCSQNILPLRAGELTCVGTQIKVLQTHAVAETMHSELAGSAFRDQFGGHGLSVGIEILKFRSVMRKILLTLNLLIATRICPLALVL